MTNKTYNGWSSYETWAVKLWMDNEESSYRYWQERTREAVETTDDKFPNQFMDKVDNAKSLLAEWLKNEHDSQSEHPVFTAADGTVYADLLNAALSEVNWHEIAGALLEDVEVEEGATDATPA